MEVGELAAALPAGHVRSVVGDPAVQVDDLTHDSQQVAPGVAFACVIGGQLDGHDFAPAAVAAGAPALLVERQLPIDVTQLVVEDTRRSLGYTAAALHGHPSRSLRTVGITGTNGKTTTAHLVAAILEHAGMRTGLLGTLSGLRTTPEAPDLQRQLAGFRDSGRTAVVLEVSSHALALHRVAGTSFDVAVFTNLGRDHLDLHGTVEEYFRAKAMLFTPELAGAGVINVDDPYGRLLADAAEIDLSTFSRADAGDVTVSPRMHTFRWRGLPVEVPLGGEFNVMNSLAALTAAATLGLPDAAAVAGIASAAPVPGRFEVITAADAPFTVVVDYAHTPDGLDELLSSTRAMSASGRTILVVGCGGDRDQEKRPLMGAAAAAGAQRVVVTSDNPRDEDPLAIIGAVTAGVPPRYRDRLAIEPDRRAAIAMAVGEARAGDVVVIAGKGHETTQTIGATTLPFDDRVVARELLEEPS